MKKLYAVIFIILLSAFCFAQPSPTPASGGTGNVKENVKGDNNEADENELEKDDPKDTSDKSKFILPPGKAKPVNIPKISSEVLIDGKIDEEIWKQAAVFKDFYQTSPGDNIAPSKPTEVYMMYDEKNLYIAFKCWDEKDKIRATVARRDDVFGEDNVRFWLDTYNDRRRAYIIGFNPFGIQADGIFSEGKGADFSVDIVMESKGVIEDWGWSVEAKIPFKSLRYTAGEGKFWGFNAARNIDRFNDEFDQWLPDDRNVSGMLIKHGRITGLDEIKYERTLEIVPSITLSQTGRRFAVYPTGNIDRFSNQNLRHDIGVTMKYTITPNITLDAAYNPDFAEIEADAPVVSANQRFPIFFEEKRPFFLEGAEIFQSPLNIFYSRTIVDPDVAVKLTGKVGKNSFGFLAASDKAPGNYDEDELNNPRLRPVISEFIDRNATFGVLRVKRDVGQENNVGFFATYRSFPEQRNVAGGFDGRFKINSRTVFSFQALASNSRRCFFDSQFEPLLDPFQAQRNREICGGNNFNEYRTGNGFAYTANYDYTTETFGYIFEVGGTSKDYRADAGFTRRRNSHYAFGGVRFSTKSNPDAKIINAKLFNKFSIRYDGQGRSQEAEADSNLSLTLQKNTKLSLNGGYNYERLFEEEFGLMRMPSRPNSGAFFGYSERSAHQGWTSINFDKQISKKINFGVGGGIVFNKFDFDFGAGPKFPRVSPAALAGFSSLDPGVGRQFEFGAGIGWKPISPLRISLDYKKISLIRKDTNKTAFDSNIASLRATYQFTRFIFLRTRVDYNSIESNFRGQFLFGWNPNPGTAFYVGYNDNLNYNGFNPYSGQYEPRFGRNSRTFFIRASYLFRKSF